LKVKVPKDRKIKRNQKRNQKKTENQRKKQQKILDVVDVERHDDVHYHDHDKKYRDRVEHRSPPFSVLGFWFLKFHHSPHFYANKAPFKRPKTGPKIMPKQA
jgi:hypothetical protein